MKLMYIHFKIRRFYVAYCLKLFNHLFILLCLFPSLVVHVSLSVCKNSGQKVKATGSGLSTKFYIIWSVSQSINQRRPVHFWKKALAYLFLTKSATCHCTLQNMKTFWDYDSFCFPVIVLNYHNTMLR